ncbi:hypothetical protein [Streptomyces kaniharaensis]|uniref:hypothetical protein n=1 Tax=Streptomyces kaniharaensis TaxID=212423 RepID=UPI0012952810|nr:hypothetical protein [Streptomyces kaniharaensis]
MDAREGDGRAGAVRTPDRPEVGGPVRASTSGALDDEGREQGDVETYAVLGED